ncbi:MAG: glycosyltransferase family 2 protein [Firmicutes bacterium]|nr:glycosyltransferase family 2 protein [Bacillota bacterium]
MKASIIIVNWNGIDLLRITLPTVIAAIKYTGVEHEIIVVDDGSRDESVDLVRNEFPIVKLVSLDQNHGFGEACNIGVKHSRNPIVVLLNNDMIVEEKFLEPLLSVFTEPDIFAVTCQIKKWDKQTVEIGMITAQFKFGFAKVKRNNQIASQEEIPAPTFYASGGASAFSKEKYLTLDGFDELYYPFYWEDMDLSYRAWKRGWRVIYQPQSVVYHKHQGTIGKSYKKNYIKEVYYKNRLLFHWRNITNRWYLTQHLLCLLPHLVGTVLIGKLYYVKGFFRAIKNIGIILERRKREKKFIKRNDTQIFNIN